MDAWSSTCWYFQSSVFYHPLVWRTTNEPGGSTCGLLDDTGLVIYDHCKVGNSSDETVVYIQRFLESENTFVVKASCVFLLFKWTNKKSSSEPEDQMFQWRFLRYTPEEISRIKNYFSEARNRRKFCTVACILSSLWAYAGQHAACSTYRP